GRDGAADPGQPVRVVGGAVERIDDPPAAGAAARRAGFFREDRVVSERRAQTTEDLGLRASIHFGDEIGRCALVSDVTNAGELFAEEPTGGARGVDGHAALER